MESKDQLNTNSKAWTGKLGEKWYQEGKPKTDNGLQVDHSQSLEGPDSAAIAGPHYRMLVALSVALRWSLALSPSILKGPNPTRAGPNC